MTTLKVRKIGNSLGIVLPKELLAHLGAAEGDALDATVVDGRLHLTRVEGEDSDLLEMAEDIMRRRREVLKVLAK